MPGKREHSHGQGPTTYAIHDDDNLDDPHRPSPTSPTSTPPDSSGVPTWALTAVESIENVHSPLPTASSLTTTSRARCEPWSRARFLMLRASPAQGPDLGPPLCRPRSWRCRARGPGQVSVAGLVCCKPGGRGPF